MVPVGRVLAGRCVEFHVSQQDRAPSAPIRIECRLSDLGMSLLEPLAALRQWAIDHLDHVLLARKTHDVSDGYAAGPNSLDHAPVR